MEALSSEVGAAQHSTEHARPRRIAVQVVIGLSAVSSLPLAMPSIDARLLRRRTSGTPIDQVSTPAEGVHQTDDVSGHDRKPSRRKSEVRTRAYRHIDPGH